MSFLFFSAFIVLFVVFGYLVARLINLSSAPVPLRFAAIVVAWIALGFGTMELSVGLARSLGLWT